MKPYKLVKWTIVGVLFVLTTISGLCLYHKEKGKIHVSAGNIATGIQKQIDSLVVVRDSLKNSIDSLDNCVKNADKDIKLSEQIVADAASSDTLKRKAELKIDSLSKESKKWISLSAKQKKDKAAIQKDVNALNKELKKSANNKGEKTIKYKPTFWTIIHFVITALLFVAFLASFILFSGILKLFNRKNNNMDQVNNNNQQPDPMVQNSAAETISNTIEPVQVVENTFNFDLPEPVLDHEIKRGSNPGECIVIIKCTRDDAEIRYCIAPDTSNVINYDAPILVNRKCTLLVMAACGDIVSKQMNINVDPANVIEKPSPKADSTSSVESKNDNVKPDTATEPTDKSKEQTGLSQAQFDRIRVFTSQPNILGVSYQGDNHIKAKPVVPCQDCHSFTKVNDVWSIAIVSDGAGSKEHSDVGSNAVCAAFTSYLAHKLQSDKRFANGDIPNERIWDLEFRAILTRFQSDLKAHKTFVAYGFESLAATIIILAYSPKGYLFAHVGDGRAGVKVNGEWKSILTPHKGDEANQTIFSTTVEFINKPTLMMSGVFVPETKVEECNIEAFVLMSDGCEDGAWATYQKVNLPNGDFRVEDVNQPRPQTLDELMTIIDSKDDQKAKLIEFITGYNKGFKTEGDDKTILIGRIK